MDVLHDHVLDRKLCICTLRTAGDTEGARKVGSRRHTFGLKENFLLLADCCQVRLQRCIVLGSYFNHAADRDAELGHDGQELRMGEAHDYNVMLVTVIWLIVCWKHHKAEQRHFQREQVAGGGPRAVPTTHAFIIPLAWPERSRGRDCSILTGFHYCPSREKAAAISQNIKSLWQMRHRRNRGTSIHGVCAHGKGAFGFFFFFKSRCNFFFFPCFSSLLSNIWLYS